MLALLLSVSGSLYAEGPKPCDELKAEIAQKLEAKGVTSYSLEIVPTEQTKDAEGKVVGSCEASSKKIVYHKTSPTQEAKATAPAKQ
jgi:hypothetical protein